MKAITKDYGACEIKMKMFKVYMIPSTAGAVGGGARDKHFRARGLLLRGGAICKVQLFVAASKRYFYSSSLACNWFCGLNN